MKKDPFDQCILDENDVISGLYTGKITRLDTVNIEDQKIIDQFNSSVDANADRIEKIIPYIQPNTSVEEFDLINQKNWLIPKQYDNFDIGTWLISQCQTDEETQRVLDELELFVQHNMIDVLICLKYLVDFMRKHNVVWGLGRGSSVASYCLYLIGIHKVNSIKYQLDIKEFLKENNNAKKNI